MLLRFAISQIDEDSHKPVGIFSAAYTLLESGELNPEEWTRLRSILDYFSANLPTPPDSFTACRAIFWFRSDAVENISHVWELVHLLRSHDLFITVYKCARLANITYRDKFQVAAYPSKLDGKITRS